MTTNTATIHKPGKFERGLDSNVGRSPTEEALAESHSFELPLDVLQEAETLRTAGITVEVATVEDPQRPYFRRVAANFMAKRLTEQVVRLRARGLEIEDSNNPMYRYSALAIWRQLGLGTGLGIYTLYNAENANTLGEGIDPSVFKKPLFDVDGKKVSAFDYTVIKEGNEIAQKKYEDHLRFIDTPIDPVSRVMFSGTEDAVGIRVRAELAKTMAVDALKGHDRTKPLILASIGAGSAVPLEKTIKALELDGHTIGEVHLVDMDPMALASAYTLLEKSGIDTDKLKLHVEMVDLRHGKIRSLDDSSVDYAEAWGFLEYFKDRMATGLAKAVEATLKPGGVFSFGNMLSRRSQKDYFEQVVRWKPTVQQRTLEEGYSILEGAGFDGKKVVLPTSNRVYVGYQGTKVVQ